MPESFIGRCKLAFAYGYYSKNKLKSQYTKQKNPGFSVEVIAVRRCRENIEKKENPNDNN